MKKVLVAGATGYLGRYAVREFKNRGYWVRALSRREAGLRELREQIDEVFIGEVTQPESLEGVCRDVDVVFSSVGITRQRDGQTYRDVDYQGNLNLLNQARQEGVSKFLYVSVLGAHQLAHLKVVAAKLAFEEALRTSGMDYSLIYPSGFFSDMLEVLKIAKRGRGYVLGDGEYKGNPIHGADLARLCVDVVDTRNAELHVGGPDILTYKEVYDLAFQALGKKSKLIKIPLWVRDLMLWSLRTFTPERIYGPLELFLTGMAMDMIGDPHGNHHLKDFFKESADAL